MPPADGTQLATRPQGVLPERTMDECGSPQAPAPTQALRKALASYRAVRFSIKTGVRAYFTAKEAARADVLACVIDCREAGR